MRRCLVCSLVSVLIGLSLVLLVQGCGKADSRGQREDLNSDDEGETTGSDARKPLIANSYDGTLTGTVSVAGSVPTMEAIVDKNHKDSSTCLTGGPEDLNQTWSVSKKGGKNLVAGAVVFLLPPEGQYFQIPQDSKLQFWRKEVSVDQPHCAFVPHVEVTFPEYWDGKKYVPSGQAFKILNSAPVAHNTRWKGGDANPGDTITLGRKEGSKTQQRVIALKPDIIPVTLFCDFHKWMTAKVWAFEHPWAAKTDKDGKFTIKNVPVGVELRIVAWHEGAPNEGYITGREGIKATLKKGTNGRDFVIKLN